MFYSISARRTRADESYPPRSLPSPPLSPYPVPVPSPHHSALCGQHCLNNLCQGPVFTLGTITDVVGELHRKLDAVMGGAYAGESPYVDYAGNYSIDVLSACLKGRYPGALLRTLNHPALRDVARNPTMCEAYVLNKDNHWFAIRRLYGKYWRLDSMKPAPEFIGEMYV